MSFLISALHVGQAILASGTGVLSYTAINKLNKYESMSEKAASYSNNAKHQLHKTRTTMISGALATLCSICSLGLIAFVAEISPAQEFLLSMVNTAATLLAYNHIREFWEGKAKIPMVTDFNDAVNTIAVMRTALLGLAGTWGAALVIYGYRTFAQLG